MDIRPVAQEDYKEAAAIWEAVELTRPWNDPTEDLDRATSGAATSTVLGGFQDGHLVATAMFGHDGHRGWIYYLAVDPDHQRQGLGVQMLKAAEDWLRNEGAVKVCAMVRHESDALGFFHHNGFDSMTKDFGIHGKWLVTPPAPPA